MGKNNNELKSITTYHRARKTLLSDLDDEYACASFNDTIDEVTILLNNGASTNTSQNRTDTETLERYANKT